MWPYKNAITLLITVLLSGCAAQTQFFSNLFQQKTKPASAEKSEKKPNAVFLISMTLRNYEKPSQQPKPFALILERVLDKKTINYWLNEKDSSKTVTLMRADRYLLRIELEPGKYILRGINSASDSYLNSGSFFTPIGAYMTASSNKFVYLGHITANLRSKQNAYENSAGTYTLLDTRMTAGTFDTDVSDQWATDITKFSNMLPTLDTDKVKKAILIPSINSVD